MTRILLVRHGETEWNAEHRVQGWTDSPLSGRGRAQASLVASRLTAMPLAAVYASDLARARDTARAIAAPHGLPVMTDPDLRERCYGEWEGLTLTELAARYPDEWDRYHRQRALDVCIPGGETWEQVAGRVIPVIHQVTRRHPGSDETIVLVGHGGSLRPAILDALAAPLSVLLRLRLDNASLSRLDYQGVGRGQAVFLNDTSHLEGSAA